MSDRMRPAGVRASGWRVLPRPVWALTLIALMVTACAVPAPRSGDPSAPLSTGQSEGEGPMIVAPPPEAAPPAVTPAPSAATLTLAAQSEQSRAAGDLRLAGLQLERALRIAPRDPELWYQMARIRLEQGDPGQAERLAERSLQLGARDRVLALANWRLIARAREALGDAEGALRAREAIAQLESALG